MFAFLRIKNPFYLFVLLIRDVYIYVPVLIDTVMRSFSYKKLKRKKKFHTHVLIIFKIINEQYEGMKLFSYNCMAKYKLVLHISIHKAVTESMKFLYISIEKIYMHKTVALSCFQLEHVTDVIIIIAILQHQKP